MGSMGQQDIIDQIRYGLSEARKISAPFILKDIFLNVPSWEEFISHLNYEYHNSSIPQQIANPGQEEIHHNGVCIRDNFYLNARMPGAKQGILNVANEVSDVLKKAFDVIEGGPLVSFINFVGNDSPLNIHYDRRDMAYWQCIGNVEWRVYGDSSKINNPDPEIYESYFLNPGDLLIIPDKIFHAVKVDGPRAAISFGYNDREWI
jgi:hypothetical protein